MNNIKNNRYYIDKIIADIEFILAHTGGISLEAFSADEVLLDSVMFRLIQISENSDKLTEEFKTQNRFVPWRAIKGMRNRIVHDYGAVDVSVIYDTVKADLPELLKLLKEI